MPKTWTQARLVEHPPLGPDSTFRFSCHGGVSCFTHCCADVNIFLTPYDVLRMKKALHIPSADFLERHTVTLLMSEQTLPLVLLKMQDDERKSCPFVTPQGCSIYEDRPWACRMFPLEPASSQTEGEHEGQKFCLIADESFPCLGFTQGDESPVREWLRDQGVDLYDAKCQAYKQFTGHPQLGEGKGIGPAKTTIFYLTCYDLDRFRELLLESSFFSRFEVDAKTIQKISTDDEALLEFGFDWLRFSLFGEDTIKVRSEVIVEKKASSKSESMGKAHEKRRKRKLSA